MSGNSDNPALGSDALEKAKAAKAAREAKAKAKAEAEAEAVKKKLEAEAKAKADAADKQIHRLEAMKNLKLDAKMKIGALAAGKVSRQNLLQRVRPDVWLEVVFNAAPLKEGGVAYYGEAIIDGEPVRVQPTSHIWGSPPKSGQAYTCIPINPKKTGGVVKVFMLGYCEQGNIDYYTANANKGDLPINWIDGAHRKPFPVLVKSIRTRQPYLEKGEQEGAGTRYYLGKQLGITITESPKSEAEMDVQNVWKVLARENELVLRYVCPKATYQGESHRQMDASTAELAKAKSIDVLKAIGRQLEDLSTAVIVSAVGELIRRAKTDDHPTVAAMMAAGRMVPEGRVARESVVNGLLQEEIKRGLFALLDSRINTDLEKIGDLPGLRELLGIGIEADCRSTFRRMLMMGRKDQPEGGCPVAKFVSDKVGRPFGWSHLERQFRSELIHRANEAEDREAVEIKAEVRGKEVSLNAMDFMGWPEWSREGVAARLKAIEGGDIPGAKWVLNQALKAIEVEALKPAEETDAIVKAVAQAAAKAIEALLPTETPTTGGEAPAAS